MKTTKKAVKVQESSGNVFADLGFRNAKDWLARAELAHQICLVIAKRQLTQAKAAEIMKLDQPKISALTHGRFKGFSVERLLRCLNDLGQEVEIIIRPTSKAGARGDTHVLAAVMETGSKRNDGGHTHECSRKN